MSNVARVFQNPAEGMITFRGDLASRTVKKAIRSVAGVAMPPAGEIRGEWGRGVGWMSPDEVMVLVPYADVGSATARLNATLSGTHVLVADVSDARVCFRVEGGQAAAVLARLCPVDFHPDSFGVGTLRRTRLAQVATAVWRHDTGFDVICFRSVADYVQGVLVNAEQSVLRGALGS